jgi:hypothetical protein
MSQGRVELWALNIEEEINKKSLFTILQLL